MREHFSLLYDKKNKSPGGNHFFLANLFQRPDRFKCEQNKIKKSRRWTCKCELGKRGDIKIPF